MSGSTQYWEDYTPGQVIDHGGGTTVEEAEHMMATRLYQNTARVHFDAAFQATTRFGKRLVYGGHIISIARSLSFNGLENGFAVAGLNAGKHAAPVYAGDTVYAATRITALETVANRADIGAIRVQQRVTKNVAADNAFANDELTDCVLDLDIWLWMPRR